MISVFEDLEAGRTCVRRVIGMMLLGCMPIAGLPAAQAAELSANDSISMLPGFVRPAASEAATRSGFNFEALYGHRLGSRWSLEFNLNGSIFEQGRNRGTDFYQRVFEMDGVFDLSAHRGAGFTPFLLAGIGVVNNDFYPENRDGFGGIAAVGLGALSGPLFKNGLMLRVEARYVHDTREGGVSEPRVSAGIEIPLGRVERVVEYREVKTVEVREVVRDLAPPAASVRDSDGDGVDDDHDKCPGTPRGLRVDSDGCAIAGQVVTLEDVNFDLDKALLTPTAVARLGALAEAFRGQPALEVEIAGHTDTSGSPLHNLALSQRRAEAVRTYLIASGVAPGRLTAHGFGLTQLLVSPEITEADRARNRRVELHIVRSR